MVGIALLLLAAPFAARATDCNRAMESVVTYVDVPGEPFAALPSRDGCWIFVSLSSGTSITGPGVALLSRRDGAVTLERTVSVRGAPSGMELTHDGKVLIASSGSGVAFLDVQRLTSGDPDPVLDYWTDRAALPGRIYSALTADDHYLFIANEAAGSLSVLDLARTRAGGFSGHAQLGAVPVGSSPVGLAFSSDGRYLFVAVQALKRPDWPQICPSRTIGGGRTATVEGAIVVVDVQRAVSDPAGAAIKAVEAGCGPVRVITAPRGGEVYVTARNSDKLLVFDERQLTTDGFFMPAREVAVGVAPIGIATIENGNRIIIANSNRLEDARPNLQSLSVVDAAHAKAGIASQLGTIPTATFPREVRSTADGQTLLVTNYSARAVELVDWRRTPWSATQVAMLRRTGHGLHRAMIEGTLMTDNVERHRLMRRHGVGPRTGGKKPGFS